MADFLSPPTSSSTQLVTMAGSKVTGTTKETTLQSYTLPAGRLGPNGMLVVDFFLNQTGSAGSRTLRVKFGGTVFTYTDAPATGPFSYWVRLFVFNRNATNNQYLFFYLNGGVEALGATTASLDTTQSQVVTVTAQLSDVTDEVDLIGFVAEMVA